MAFAVGPVIGTGYNPSGNAGQQLENITRRAFIPSLVVQIYQATPTLSAGLANAQMASGGISSVTAPVQGAALTTAAYSDFSGAFDPTPPVGSDAAINNAQYNLKILVVPIQFNGIEGLIQDNAAVIPLHEARMNDAGNQAASLLSGDLLTSGTTTDGTSITGFPALADNTLTLGGIPRNGANLYWNAGAIVAGASPNNARSNWIQYLTAAFNKAQGEMANMVVMGPGTWVNLAQSFMAIEQVQITPANSFPAQTQGPGTNTAALIVAGVPIYMDINCPEGTAYIYNTRYTSFYMHSAAAFVFTGFASLIPNNSLGFQGVLVAALEFLTVKPKSITKVTGLDSVSVAA